MFKAICVCLILLSCNGSTSTNNDIDSSLLKYTKIENIAEKLDSLKKYSYFFYAKISPSHWEQGSGFFIRKNNKLYFISDLHSFTGQTIDLKKIPNYPDTLGIRLNDPEKKCEVYKIPIAEIKRNTKDIPFYLRADAWAYPIDTATIPKDVTIYSVENLIDTNFNYHEVHEAITCGYPNLHSSDTLVAMKAHPVLTKQTIYGDYCKKMYFSNYKSYDTIDYSVTAYTDYGGYSGSPVYLLYKNKIIFGGLLSSGSLPQKAAMVVRPQYVLDKIPH